MTFNKALVRRTLFFFLALSAWLYYDTDRDEFLIAGIVYHVGLLVCLHHEAKL